MRDCIVAFTFSCNTIGTLYHIEYKLFADGYFVSYRSISKVLTCRIIA